MPKCDFNKVASKEHLWVTASDGLYLHDITIVGLRYY